MTKLKVQTLSNSNTNCMDEFITMSSSQSMFILSVEEHIIDLLENLTCDLGVTHLKWGAVTLEELETKYLSNS